LYERERERERERLTHFWLVCWKWTIFQFRSIVFTVIPFWWCIKRVPTPSEIRVSGNFSSYPKNVHWTKNTNGNKESNFCSTTHVGVSNLPMPFPPLIHYNVNEESIRITYNKIMGLPLRTWIGMWRRADKVKYALDNITIFTCKCRALK
jgi:hypothetical protein